jgi:hypothetical protein
MRRQHNEKIFLSAGRKTAKDYFMKKNMFFGRFFRLAILAVLAFVVIIGVTAQTQSRKKVASDGARIQTANSKIPTRVITNGTKINMHFKDVIIPGILNDSETAQALIKMLPYTVSVRRYSHDFCGVMKNPLPYREENVHYGWLNGDIDFSRDADYFTILFEDEENSEQYGHQVNIGVIDCELSKISTLRGSYDVYIVLAQ